MNKIIFAAVLLCIMFAGLIWGSSADEDSKEIIYVGTYADRGSEGLYVFEFERNTAQFTQIQLVSDREGPNFQAIHPNGQFLYSVSVEEFSDETNDDTISAYRISKKTGELTLINEQSTEGDNACHVSIDPLGRFAYVSNYNTGNLSVYLIEKDGSLSEAVDVIQHEGRGLDEQRQRGPHMHSIIPSADGRFIYASDLGIDKVKIYEVDRQSGKLSPAEVPYVENTPGSGPRHFTIHPNGQFAYSVEELSYTVAAFQVNQSNGALTQIQRVSMVPDDYEGTNSAADLHISPDGKFLYASNRGHDSLVIYSIDETTGELVLVGYEPTRGGHPRNFMIDREGEFVMVANRDNDNVVLFQRNKSTGGLTYTGQEIEVPMAVCVTQLFLN